MQNQDKIYNTYSPFIVDKNCNKLNKVYTDNYNNERKLHKKRIKEIEKSLTIKPREVWANYNNKIKKEIDIYTKELETIVKSRKYIYDKLLYYKSDLKKYSNIDFESIVKTKSLNRLSFLKVDSKFKDIDNFKFNWKLFIPINRQYFKVKNKIEILNKRLLPFKHWIKIIKKFNKRIVDLIIQEGYEFHLGHGLDYIRIQKRIRNNPEINNPASYQKRKKIISEGKIPYNKKTAPNGERWKVYRTERYKYVWYWSKKSINVKNSFYYTFKPTGGKKGMICSLYKFINENPNHTIKYKY
tara:strand:- start:1265 stop:2158 length:894 start_codon:yes stop_codon:yes gene_type:complete